MNQSALQISVVIPVGNGSGKLGSVLEALAASRDVNFEVVLVADRVRDDSLRVAVGYPFCKVLEDNEVYGVSAARNRGAIFAGAPVVVFIDSDIKVQPHTLARVVDAFNRDDKDGLVGLLSPAVPFKNFASQLKNLWMRWTYDRLPDRIALFYTSLAAIKREHFLRSGGFDRGYIRPSIEDTDLGGRLALQGSVVVMARDLEVVHLKRYTIWQLWRTDFVRSVALVRFALRDRFRRLAGGNTTAVPTTFILLVGLVPVLLFVLLIGYVSGEGLWWSAAGLVVLLMWLLNASFFGYLIKYRGSWFAMRSLLFLIPQAMVCFIGALWGLVGYFFGKKY